MHYQIFPPISYCGNIIITKYPTHGQIIFVKYSHPWSEHTPGSHTNETPRSALPNPVTCIPLLWIHKLNALSAAATQCNKSIAHLSQPWSACTLPCTQPWSACTCTFPHLMGPVHRCSTNTLTKDHVVSTSRCCGQETEHFARTFSHKRFKHGMQWYLQTFPNQIQIGLEKCWNFMNLKFQSIFSFWREKHFKVLIIWKWRKGMLAAQLQNSFSCKSCQFASQRF